MRSDPTLKRWFRVYNRRYFQSSLPAATKVLWAEEIQEDLGATTDDPSTAHTMAATDVSRSPTPPEIYLNRRILPFWKVVRATLLHEMAHVAKPRAGHGAVFDAEIGRLWEMGAFKGLL